MTTKFFVELFADEYGNTAMQTAVVEANLKQKDDRDFLVPVAPEHFAKGWPTGWYRDTFGGWAEVDGPARMLSHEEHKALVASLSEEVKADAKSGLVTLRTGVVMPKMMVNVVMMSLRHLIENDPIVFYELVMVARDPHHRIFGNCGARLINLHLLEPDGQPHDITRQIVLAASEGEMLEMKLVNPVAA